MSKFTDKEKQEKIDAVLALVPDMSVRLACDGAGVPYSTFSNWVTNADLQGRYTAARTLYHEKLAGEILSLADEPIDKDDFGKTDNGLVQQRRTQIDSRKWLLSKLAPKKYGDRLMLAGDEDHPVTVQAVQLKVIDNKQKVIDDGT